VTQRRYLRGRLESVLDFLNGPLDALVETNLDEYDAVVPEVKRLESRDRHNQGLVVDEKNSGGVLPLVNCV
jgi:small nuclear ribonucleoprotein (snRNP)-like protein